MASSVGSAGTAVNAAGATAIAAGATAAVDARSTGRAGWMLTFSDEFEGVAGTAPDPTKWNLSNQGDGFGNNELEFYTNRTDNAALDGRGSLVITARRESFSNHDYTSARLDTYKKFEQLYGRFEARIQVPRGQGLWPAFWMLGANVLEVSWPDCGEIDIMQNIGNQPSTILGTLEGPGYSGAGTLQTPYMLAGGAAFADDFHLFAIEWEQQAVRFYVDEQLYATRTPAELPSGARWIYDHPFYLLLNVAVGGEVPGPPDATTVFPQVMTIDYVRAYQRQP